MMQTQLPDCTDSESEKIGSDIKKCSQGTPNRKEQNIKFKTPPLKPIFILRLKKKQSGHIGKYKQRRRIHEAFSCPKYEACKMIIKKTLTGGKLSLIAKLKETFF